MDERFKPQNFSRLNPSPRYRALLAQYRAMHEAGDRNTGAPAESTFAGFTLLRHLGDVKRLIVRSGALTILDYGAGKGFQYRPRLIRVEGEPGRWDGVAEYWDVDNVTCYDPAYAPLSARPEGKFDGVVCTDVLEHCPVEDIEWVVGDLFAFARRFVFATVSCSPATKRLPNGENAHCTQRPPAWWRERFVRAAQYCPEVDWELLAYTIATGPGETDQVERFTSPLQSEITA